MSRLIFRFALLTLLTTTAVLSTRAGFPRPDDRADSKWFRKLPGDVTVELIGIADPEAKPAVWWTPEGKPLVAPINNVAIGRTKADQQVRTFALRVEGPSIRDREVLWDFGKFFGGEEGNGLVDGEPVHGVEFATVGMPTNAASWTIRLEVAAGRWVTDATRTSNGEVKVINEERSVIFSPPHAIDRGTAVVVAEDFPVRDVRVVAFDKGGKQRSVSYSRGGWYSKAFRLHDASLIGIKLEEIDRIELQSRPLEKVEFRDVPLAVPQR